MTPDTVVQLGDFSFSGLEVPERIPLIGDQALAIQQLVGGKKIVESMGPVEGPLEWSGRFQGADAKDRARYLITLRKAGKPLKLTWSDFSFTVVIRSFVPDFERAYQLPYKIVCEVVEDLSQPITEAPDPSTDAMMSDDMDTATGLGGDIGDDGLTGLLGGLQAAVSAVSDFASAGLAVLTSVLAPLNAAQAYVGGLIVAAEGIFVDGASLGGLTPGLPASQLSAALLGQQEAGVQVTQLYEIQSTLGRMATNLGAVGASGTPITMAGGDLYRLAADTYGDASAWPTIAKANGLTDPVLDGLQDLIVPPKAGASDGILHGD